MLNMLQKTQSEEVESFDSIEFIKEFGGLEIMLNVLTHLGFHDEADEIADQQYALIYGAAVAAIYHQTWNSSKFLSFYPNLRSIFDQVQYEKEESKRVNSLRRPYAIGKVTVYCPGGCNQIRVSADEPWDSCAACGQLMTERAENIYYDSLVRSGQVM